MYYVIIFKQILDKFSPNYLVIKKIIESIKVFKF